MHEKDLNWQSKNKVTDVRRRIQFTNVKLNGIQLESVVYSLNLHYCDVHMATALGAGKKSE